MIVCSCNVLSDGQVRGCLEPGPGCPRTAAQVYQCLGCSPKCGRCARTIRGIVAAALGTPHLCASSCAAECPLAHAVETAETARPMHERPMHDGHMHDESLPVMAELAVA